MFVHSSKLNISIALKWHNVTSSGFFFSYVFLLKAGLSLVLQSSHFLLEQHDKGGDGGNDICSFSDSCLISTLCLNIHVFGIYVTT